MRGPASTAPAGKRRARPCASPREGAGTGHACAPSPMSRQEASPMTRSNSLDTDSQGQDRGDSTPGPEGKPLSSDERAPADGAGAHMPTGNGDTR
ncbi:hypothetical protein BVI2075_590002 [Burkholderia vietnamiensis]|nr:hypothetical protein BVI2075_590002 [Burkholderia vietnamiensis]